MRKVRKVNKQVIALDFYETGASETVPGNGAVWIMFLVFILVLLPVMFPILSVSFLVRCLKRRN